MFEFFLGYVRDDGGEKSKKRHYRGSVEEVSCSAGIFQVGGNNKRSESNMNLST